MTRSKISIAVALASFLFATQAFAQATTGSPRKGSMAMAGDEKVKAAQQALKDKGHDPGNVDGRMGPKTQAALRDFQKAQGLQASGRLDAKTMQSLGMDGDKTSSMGGSARAAARRRRPT